MNTDEIERLHRAAVDASKVEIRHRSHRFRKLRPGGWQDDPGLVLIFGFVLVFGAFVLLLLIIGAVNDPSPSHFPPGSH